MNQIDYYEYQYKNLKVRGLSLQGMNKARVVLGVSPIPRPKPGEDIKVYKDCIRPLRAETLELLRKQPPEFLRLVFGEDCRDLIEKQLPRQQNGH